MSQEAETASLPASEQESQVLQPDPKPLSEGNKSQSKKKLEERSRKAAAKLNGLPVDNLKEQLPVVTRERRRVIFNLPEKEQPSAEASARESKKRKHRSPSTERSPSKGKKDRKPSKEKKRHKSGVVMAGTSSTKKKSKSDTPKERKPHRFKPGTVAAREIKRFSWNKNDMKFIPRGPFNRIINDILASYSLSHGLRMSKTAREALRGEAEDWVVRLLRGSNQCAQLCGRDTLFATDIGFFQNLCTYYAGKDLERQKC